MSKDDFIPDGKIHRFNGAGKNTGWYISHGDWGAWGDWKTGEKHAFNNGKDISNEKKLIILQKTRTEKSYRERTIARQAWALWEAMEEYGNHPYLGHKGVDNFGGKFDGGIYYVPMQDAQGRLWNLQRIVSSGDKYFMKDARVRGCFHLIGEIKKTVILCEGYATGASIAMACRGVTVVVGFNAGNLPNVIWGLLREYPDLRIIIAADNDQYTESGNAGLRIAERCKQDFGCNYILPVFKDEETKPTDFNDLHLLEGLGVVQDQIHAAIVED
jgi:putative DNA primase/helicase